MKKSLSIIICFFSLSIPALSSEILLTLSDMVPECDIIVIGALGATTRTESGDNLYFEVWLTIDDVIFGAIAHGDSLLVQWVAHKRVVCPRTDHSGRTTPKIWLLTTKDNGAYQAQSNQLVRDISERAEIERILRQFPVRVKPKQLYAPGDPATVALIFRNATAQAVRIPKYEMRNGILYLHPSVGITSGDYRLMSDYEQERVRMLPESETILVQSGAEYAVTVDVSRVLLQRLPSPGHAGYPGYAFQFWIGDYPIFRRTWFRYGR